MKKKAIAALITQIVATVFWIVHIDYLRGYHSDRKYKLGVQSGRENLQEEIIERGGEIPEGVYVHCDKDLMINLGEGFHYLVVLYPLIAFQGTALILLICLGYSRFPTSGRLLDKDAEQVAACDR